MNPSRNLALVFLFHGHMPQYIQQTRHRTNPDKNTRHFQATHHSLQSRALHAHFISGVILSILHMARGVSTDRLYEYVERTIPYRLKVTGSIQGIQFCTPQLK
jgi:hypothetical protein